MLLSILVCFFFLVGGFNPIENYSSKSDHLPRDRGKKNKKKKPPPSGVFIFLFAPPSMAKKPR